jgi:hypothetical protein
MHIGYWWESKKKRDHWEDQDVGGWTIIKWVVEGSCEHGDELSGSIKGWKVLEWLHNWRLLKKGLGP